MPDSRASRHRIVGRPAVRPDGAAARDQSAAKAAKVWIVPARRPSAHVRPAPYSDRPTGTKVPRDRFVSCGTGSWSRICQMRACVIAVLLLLADSTSGPDLWAQTAPPPPAAPQVTPQLNNPGPQLTIPQPASPAQQSSPPSTSAPSIGSQSVPERSPAVGQPRQRSATHRHGSRTDNTSTPRSTAAQGASCSYPHCVQRCMDSGQVFFIVGRRGGSSCQDQCKHKGCGYRDPILSDR